jgi:hypothetical protein
MKEFSIMEADATDTETVIARLGRPLSKHEKIICFSGLGWRDYIVAVSAFPSINEGHFLKTPPLGMFERYTGTDSEA